jgi:mannose-6-phosphate isomerase-like protein (cupin superfamily)
MDVVNISEKLNRFQDHWNPRIIAELNGQHVKLAKLKGAFDMHLHEEEDEMFLVIKGTLKMNLEKETKVIREGEFIVIPKGTLHQPVAEEEVEVMLFEPNTTLNTGNVESDFTKTKLDTI